MGWLKWVLALLIVAIIVLIWYCRPQPPAVVTTLRLEAYGGFAYIQPPGANELSIAFLKDYRKIEKDAQGSDQVVCNVDQLGTELMVISGTIVSATNTKTPSMPIPSNRTFDLAGAVVTFPDLNKSSQPLTVVRGPRPPAPPFGPADPNNQSEWEDVKWVPGMSYNSGKPRQNPNYPQSTLDPNWPNKVDGRVVLTRGVVTALHPSDVAVKDSVFEFRSSSGSRSSYKQAITDRTLFTADIPADQIVINLTGAASGFSQVIVRPAAPGRPVKLLLKGLHTHDTKPVLPVNAAVEHFCTFYQLLQPVPDFKDQLIPHLFSGPTIASAGFSGQPSPGALCPGDWYPE